MWEHIKNSFVIWLTQNLLYIKKSYKNFSTQIPTIATKSIPFFPPQQKSKTREPFFSVKTFFLFQRKNSNFLSSSAAVAMVSPGNNRIIVGRARALRETPIVVPPGMAVVLFKKRHTSADRSTFFKAELRTCIVILVRGFLAASFFLVWEFDALACFPIHGFSMVQAGLSWINIMRL